MTYFNNPQNLQELRQQYYKLALQHHPDRGGSTEAMQDINNEYEDLFKRLERGEKFYQDHHTDDWFDEKWHNEDVWIRERIDELVAKPGIDIEICGTWIWVTGDTKPVKEILKEKDFKFSGKKVAWYWHSPGYRKFGKGEWSLDKIRNVYGSQKIKKQERRAIEQED